VLNINSEHEFSKTNRIGKSIPPLRRFLAKGQFLHTAHKYMQYTTWYYKKQSDLICISQKQS